jgi:hypothetical protein
MKNINGTMLLLLMISLLLCTGCDNNLYSFYSWKPIAVINPADVGISSPWFGTVITDLGDLDQDGVTDIAVGAYGDPGVSGDPDEKKGAVWILFLRRDGTVKDVTKIGDNSGGFTGTLDRNARFGFSCTAMGDIDGDGITDLAVGSRGGTPGNIWILFLQRDGTVREHVRISDNAGGLPSGVMQMDSWNLNKVKNIGDIDGNGVNDVAVSFPKDDYMNAEGTMLEDSGAVLILFLNSGGTVNDYHTICSESEELANKEIFYLRSVFGVSLAPLGDLDGDAVPDIAVGSRSERCVCEETCPTAGRVWILFLNSDGTVKETNCIHHVPETLGKESHFFGYSMLALGDINEDHVTDLIVRNFPPTGYKDFFIVHLNSDGSVKHAYILDKERYFLEEYSKVGDWSKLSGVIHDLNGDGASELVFWNQSESYPEYGVLHIIF